MTARTTQDTTLEERFEAAVQCRPVFVVGCPRSGTTLTRLLLDRHPDVAIPRETHFILGLRPRSRLRSHDHLQRILSHPRTQLWEVDLRDVEQLVKEAAPPDYPGTVRAAMAAYAALKGKTAWGDKTPGFVLHLPRLAKMFPDARFVHVIRDGRESAVSMAEQPWGPPTRVSAGHWWRRKVAGGRRAGQRLGHHRYLELRLERLIDEPEAELRRLCEFMELAWTPDMLDFHREATTRVPGAGRGLHQHLAKPITPDLRDWRRALSVTQQHLVQAACGPLLVELGYVPTAEPWRWRGAAGAVRAIDIVRTAPRFVRDQVRPGRRMY